MRKFSSIKKIYKLALEITGDYQKQFKKSMILFIISYVLQGLAFTMFFPLLKAIFAKNAELLEILFYFVFILCFSILSLFAQWYARNFDFSGNIVDVTNDLRVKLGEKLRNMPLNTLTKYKTGDLNSILASSVEESVLALGSVASIFLQITIVPIVVVVFTFFVDYRLAFLMLILVPFVYILYLMKRKASIVEKEELSLAHTNLEASLIEYVQGINVLRSVNQVGKNSSELYKSVRKVRDIQISGAHKTTLPLIILASLIEIMMLIMIFFGSMWVNESTLAFITLASMLLIISRLTEPLMLFTSVASIADIMDNGFKRIKEILDIKELKVKQPIQVTSSFDIEFEKVFYAYNKEDGDTLKDINFKLKENSLTAIVGHSGCGKTTITKLLTRYDDISKGVIKVGGVDITHMTQQELMKDISIVFQDVYLFEDSILNNLKMAKPSASKEEIIQACKMANCHDFIEKFPEGYETNIGDLGGNLSGGEKQRISIARAILKDAPIIILDEPTASLDVKSELAVQVAIDSLIENRTVIVIAHRLSTITHANKILVMNEGEIVEQGSHNELLNSNEIYKNMWEAQTRTKSWNV